MSYIFTQGTYNAYHTQVKSYEVSMDKKSSTLDALHIVMVSDTHFGFLSGKEHAKQMVEQINNLKPDLVLFAGDIVDDDVRYFKQKDISSILSRIHSKYGVFGIIGNHDLRGGREPFEEQIRESGITLLSDSVTVIDNAFYLAGREDYTNKERQTVTSILSSTDLSELPLIMMDHQPNALEEARINGVDLLLSGHTHHGQMTPNQLITHMLYENDYGYFKKDTLQSIVSSGYGFWGAAVRLGSQSEIVQTNVSFK
jgi:predicted MPP superfamily phosphohydrolase